MAENSHIQWCDHTWKPWRGCSKVNAGCTNCYAEKNRAVLAHGTKWGTEKQGGTRTVAAEGTWKEPLKWNNWIHTANQVRRESIRPRVFLGSLMDWAEDWQGPMVDHNGHQLMGEQGVYEKQWSTKYEIDLREPLTISDVRRRMFGVIDQCKNLDFLMLTKRPENIRKFWVEQHGLDGYGNQKPGGKFVSFNRSNVWLGTSVANQETSEQAIPGLLKCRDLAKYLFLSVEPLVGPVDLHQWLYDGFSRSVPPEPYLSELIDWVIIGGESGPNARPCNIKWIRDLVKQCEAAGVACFVKQLGAQCWEYDRVTDYPNVCKHQIAPCHPKGGDPEEWPVDLRIRQFPGQAVQKH